MDGETVAGRPAGGMGGTDCPESGGSSPEEEKTMISFDMLLSNAGAPLHLSYLLLS